MKRTPTLIWLAAGLLIIAPAVIWGATSAASAPGARAGETVPALTKAATPPVIDGVLDDAAWAAGLKFDAFKTLKPDYGKEASQKTESYIAYDAENFYFAFRCYDSEPSKIKAAVSKRDNVFQDDLVFINIDTFNDNQSAFVFMVNPLGIQGDGMLTVNGNVEVSFDAVWYSAGRIDDKGWTVEARVPLQSIRFPKRDVLTWKILFIRFFTRTSEQVSFPPLDPNLGSLMGQAQSFQVSGLRYKRVMELIPAATTRFAYENQGGEMTRTERTPLKNVFSLTGKLGVTSDLTLDATYNPDFSQVEADAGQIDFNLRYSLYYEEKRPFFLERNDIWQFGGAMEEAPLISLVYTRTIVDPTFGFRLTGKITPRDTIATIYAQDTVQGDPMETGIDKHPDVMIARYKHSLKDDAFIGAFYTGRENGSGYNRVGGVDGRFRLSPLETVSFHLFGSLTRDPGAEKTNADHALSFAYNYGTRKVYIDLGYQDISENFRADTGFLFRTGLKRLAAFGMYTFYPKSKFFQRIQPFYWSYHLFDTIYDKWETANVFVLRFFLPRNTMVRFDGLLVNEVFAGKLFDQSGYGFMMESQLAKSLYVQTRVRRQGNTYYDPSDPYQGYGMTATAAVQYQPIDKLDFILSLSYVDFYRKLDRAKIYDYMILRSRNTLQLNKYLFVRGIVEYNDFYKKITLDGLISFTYIPGTVVHLGYGSALQKVDWDEGLQGFAPSSRFHEMQRGFFFKVSYLYRI
jgi:hypothetical protein